MTCLRLKASICRMSLAVRSTPEVICVRDLTDSASRDGIVQEQRGMALNDGEDVVELVGDAGGHLSDRRQAFLAHHDFLAFHQGFLGLFAFVDLLLQTLGPFIHQLEDLLIALLLKAPPPAGRPAIPPVAGQQHRRAAQDKEGGSLIKWSHKGKEARQVPAFGPPEWA